MNPDQFEKAWKLAETAIRAGNVNDYHAVYEACVAAGLDAFKDAPIWLSTAKADDVVSFVRSMAYYTNVERERKGVEVMRHSQELVRINAPRWYRNDEFRLWLNQPKTATWHAKGAEPNEYSDVFTTFCQGEGSDWPGSPLHPGIPDFIWDELSFRIFEAIGWNADCLVWISNLE